ncbi:hypothetical protein HRR83_000822 [Exophiala dermatitidis]|uniref:Aminoglycoside phosphotransferase domain-containing protein n=1 Tax=Exophiala dermatitidis TaxID=5970 RepID=A0AAN6J365_EXODE|nr:hypothetical protein HRR74_000826 [Exophiala dermatitidis]KAJ4528704.1 hypothetical protein HRR73_001327 [Exophiala dermatitidis]KAJ4530087.1 hypothetical protein HRR76_009323 [Exophiala dermatitidis]KAJ4558850.1 hypothetical protein HRR77_000825 [Exophiala dermatitidis]KAJ4581124.1 hypothetical protein HRR79_000173 [Exophiala dermatitidis]
MLDPPESFQMKPINPTVNEDPPALLGSTSWDGADAYETGDEFHQRATAFFAAVKWDQLVSLSSRLRGGIPCTLGEKFSIGHFNMVRRILFEDGISWVARLRLPRLGTAVGDRDTLDEARTLKVEVASMNFLQTKTCIPIPKIYGYSVDANNEVGAPYILMDYINGSVATELRMAKNCDVGLFGTFHQDRKFREQMARIQVTLSSFEFDRIGSLYQDEITSEFFIGPDAETGKGPWMSSMDYYADLANHALQDCVANAGADVQTSWSFAVPVLFKHLISFHGHDITSEGPFKLTNRDFGAHNLLVNNDFEIIGVIDLDGVMAAPIDMVAQYPQLSGLAREPPGHIETRPLAIDRIARTTPKFEEYKNFVETTEAELDPKEKGKPTIANLLLSDAASIVQGLLCYAGHQKFVNDKWMEAYCKLLRKISSPQDSLS